MFQHKLILLGIFAFCVIVFCEARYRCCPPERWEGNIRSTFIISSNGSLSLIMGDSNFSYDATLQRVSIRSMYSDEKGNLISNRRILMDYKTGIRYEVTVDKCQGSVIGKINDSCISEYAPILSHSRVGFGEDVLGTTTYKVNATGGHQMKITVIDQSCIALSIELEEVENGKVSAFSTMLYRNVKHGIKDPDVFNIPASCDKWNSTVNIPPIGRRFAHI